MKNGGNIPLGKNVHDRLFRKIGAKSIIQPEIENHIHQLARRTESNEGWIFGYNFNLGVMVANPFSHLDALLVYV